MVIVLLGPPGVGKGTQGALLAEERRWRRIVTGDLLRSATRDGTELGEKARSFMEAGELVPDALIVAMVKEALEDLPADQEVVFDGFPRTVPQAESLEEALPEVGRKVDAILVLEADDETVVLRLSGRRSCPGCGAVYNVHFDPPAKEGICDQCGAELVHRKDDAPETVRHRLEVYRSETEPLIRFYEKSDAVVIRIQGDDEIEKVQEAIQKSVDGVIEARVGREAGRG